MKQSPTKQLCNMSATLGSLPSTLFLFLALDIERDRLFQSLSVFFSVRLSLLTLLMARCLFFLFLPPLALSLSSAQLRTSSCDSDGSSS